MNSIVDYVPMITYFGICLMLQLAYNVFTIDQVNEIDSVPIQDIGKEFIHHLEGTKDNKARSTYEPVPMNSL